MLSPVRQFVATAIAAVGFCGSAFAAPILSTAIVNPGNPALGIAFGAGNLPQSVSSTISFSETDTISSLAIVVAVNHTYITDLVYTLTNGSATVTLLNRTTLGNGSGANLSQLVPLTFTDQASLPEEAAGNDRYPDFAYQYNAATNCNFNNHTIGVDAGCLETVFRPQDSLEDAFAGLSIFGDWTLTVSDREMSGDSGWFASWSMRVNELSDDAVDDGDLTQVSEPAALGLLAFGLFGLALRRKRRMT